MFFNLGSVISSSFYLHIEIENNNLIFYQRRCMRSHNRSSCLCQLQVNNKYLCIFKNASSMTNLKKVNVGTMKLSMC